MESWLSPLFDADGIRAVDRWAIEEQGIAAATQFHPEKSGDAGAAVFSNWLGALLVN